MRSEGYTDQEWARAVEQEWGKEDDPITIYHARYLRSNSDRTPRIQSRMNWYHLDLIGRETEWSREHLLALDRL